MVHSSSKIIRQNDVYKTPEAFFHMRHVGGLNRQLKALEQTLADIESI